MLTFVLSIRANLKNQLEYFLENLRTHFPDSTVIVINDGDPLLDISDLQKVYDFAYKEHHKSYWHYGMGGLYLNRFFKAFIEHPADFMILIDSDARVFRPFKNFPGDQPAFGTIASSSGFRYLHGGVCAFRRDVAERFANGFFLQPLYANPFKWTMPGIARSQKTRDIPAQDTMVSHGLYSLGIPFFEYPDWFSTSWKRHNQMHPLIRAEVENENLKYSITHPWKVK